MPINSCSSWIAISWPNSHSSPCFQCILRPLADNAIHSLYMFVASALLQHAKLRQLPLTSCSNFCLASTNAFLIGVHCSSVVALYRDKRHKHPSSFKSESRHFLLRKLSTSEATSRTSYHSLIWNSCNDTVVFFPVWWVYSISIWLERVTGYGKLQEKLLTIEWWRVSCCMRYYKVPWIESSRDNEDNKSCTKLNNISEAIPPTLIWGL